MFAFLVLFTSFVYIVRDKFLVAVVAVDSDSLTYDEIADITKVTTCDDMGTWPVNNDTRWLIWSQTVVGMTWILSVPPSFPLAQPLPPNFHQPRQNWADSGTAKMKVNPNQVQDLTGHPVQG